jgi:hypothetical protein
VTHRSWFRLAAGLVIAAGVAVGASAAGARSNVTEPQGLRAFLLRADEPSATSFTRTPAFGWDPFPAATGYEFQISTSSAFRDNGTIWKCPSVACPALTTPVAAPNVTLPWVSGTPHGLYARTRAILPDGTKSGWSDAYGFDVEPPAPPTPLASRPGVLRWTPVAGANGYQVWLVDAGNKVETVFTNVADEREFYTFHQASQWTGSVRWRVRALRSDWRPEDRVNGVPATQHGAWSPIYKSTNPNPASGALKLGDTISDVASNGGATDDAHRLMPAFTWSGNESIDGTRAELYRVYVFTDKRCLNRVFTGSVVGGSGYAPRPYGGLNLPVTATALAEARTIYLPDVATRSQEAIGTTSDGEKILSSESKKSATATTTLALLASAGGAASATPPFMSVPSDADLGAPVSLWDHDWPRGGYYWTVVPVKVLFGGAGTTLSSASPKGSTTILVSSAPGFAPGQQIQVGSGSSTEIATITAVSGGALTLAAVTLNAHAAGEPVARLAGAATYQDMEQPEDACAAGRVSRFGIDSEPTLVAGDDPFASGLTVGGRLTSAVHTAAFYKAPLVAWTPVLGANAYQVQWSSKSAPFEPVAGPTGGEGILTGTTSYVLPLTPGTWYYRVRGFDWSLPTGAQQMGWSDVAKIVITKPTFKVIASVAPMTAKRK